MSRRFSLRALALFGFLFVACNAQEPAVDGESAVGGEQGRSEEEEPVGDSDEMDPPGPIVPAEKIPVPYEADVVFDQEVFRSFNIKMDEEEWEALRLNAMAKEYVPAELEIDGDSLGKVGVRFKGGWTLSSCFEYGPVPICRKMSLKIKVNEYEPDKRWHGMKRIVLNAMKADPTLMRERVAYKIWRDMGVVASHAVHAKVELNGEFHGLFSHIEAIDGRFTDHYWGKNGDGNLYKETWPRDDDTDRYDEGLRTNEDTAEHAGILAFSNELRNASALGEDAVVDVIPKYMDTDALLRFMAIDFAISHWDGVTAFYCRSAAGCLNHNFYLYQHEERAFFELLPWDMDASLSDDYFLMEGVPRFNDPVGPCMQEYTVFNTAIEAPNCDPLLRGLALSDQGAYVQALQDLLDGPLDLSAIQEDIDTWSSQIREAVGDDVSYSTMQWEEDLLEMGLQLAAKRARVEAELAAHQ